MSVCRFARPCIIGYAFKYENGVRIKYVILFFKYSVTSIKSRGQIVRSCNTIYIRLC